MPEAIEHRIDVAGLHMRMPRRFVDRQYGRETGVTPGCRLYPFIACSCYEDFGETPAHLWPRCAVVLVREPFSVDAHHFQEAGVELRLDGSHRHKSAVAGRIAAIEWRAAVDDIVSAMSGPAPLLTEGLERRH